MYNIQIPDTLVTDFTDLAKDNITTYIIVIVVSQVHVVHTCTCQRPWVLTLRTLLFTDTKFSEISDVPNYSKKLYP